MARGQPEPDGAAEQEAFEVAVALIARRERSEAELREGLRERGVGEAASAAAVARLVAVGELDDERFARRYAEDKRELRGWGPERIREALARRGIAPEVAAAAAGGEPAADQAARAARLLERRGEVLGDERARARALAFLARRGFDYEVAYEAVRRAAA